MSLLSRWFKPRPTPPRCEWISPGLARCIEDKGHDGVCVTRHSRHYLPTDEWQVYCQVWYGINYGPQ